MRRLPVLLIAIVLLLPGIDALEPGGGSAWGYEVRASGPGTTGYPSPAFDVTGSTREHPTGAPAAGAPEAAAPVEVVDAAGAVLARSVSDALGDFTLGVPPAVLALGPNVLTVISSSGTPDEARTTVVVRTVSGPSAPTGIAVLSRPTGAWTLTWQQPATDGGSPVTSYHVLRSSASGVVDLGVVTARALVDPAPERGADVTYLVAASNAYVSGAPATVQLRVGPAAPTDLTVTDEGHAANLSWVAPADTQGLPIVGYDIFRGGGLVASGVTGTTWADAAPGSPDTLGYTVHAVTSDGFGANASASIPWNSPVLMGGPAFVYVCDHVSSSTVACSDESYGSTFHGHSSVDFTGEWHTASSGTKGVYPSQTIQYNGTMTEQVSGDQWTFSGNAFTGSSGDVTFSVGTLVATSGCLRMRWDVTVQWVGQSSFGWGTFIVCAG